MFIDDDEKAPLETSFHFFIRETFVSPKQATSFASETRVFLFVGISFRHCFRVLDKEITVQIISTDNWQLINRNKE